METKTEKCKRIEKELLEMLNDFGSYRATNNSKMNAKLVNLVFSFYDAILVLDSYEYDIKLLIKMKCNEFEDELSESINRSNLSLLDFDTIKDVLYLYSIRRTGNVMCFFSEFTMRNLLDNDIVYRNCIDRELMSLLIYRLFEINIEEFIDIGKDTNTLTIDMYNELEFIRDKYNGIYRKILNTFNIKIPFYIKNVFIRERILKLDQKDR